MTAFLGAYLAKKKKTPLYLDIRDIFPDTLSDILPKGLAIVVKPFLSALEKWTIGKAKKVNLISEGFAIICLDLTHTGIGAFFLMDRP